MQNLLSITAPIFILVALGYIAVRYALLPAEAVPGMGRSVVYLLMPAMIVSALSKVRFEDVLHPAYLLAYGGGSLLTFLLILGVARLFMRRDLLRSSVMAMGTATSNSAFFGFPVLLQFFGEPPTIAFSLGLIVENVVMLPLAMLLLETTFQRDGSERTGRQGWLLLQRIVSNPLIIAIVLGVLLSLLQLKVPAVLDRSLQMLAAAAAPVALLVIGGSLVGATVAGDRSNITLIVTGKLLLHPVMVALLIVLLPPFEPRLQQSAILFAAMPMMSIYPIIGGNYGFRTMSSSALLLATVLSFMTITTALALLSSWS